MPSGTHPQTSGQMTLESIRVKDLYLQTKRENYINILQNMAPIAEDILHYVCIDRILLSCLLPLAFFWGAEVNREK